MITKSDWQVVHQQLMDDERRRVGGPPTVEEMLAYSRGQLSGDAEARVREQLMAHPDLLRAVTEPFPEAAEPGHPDYLSDGEFATHWASLQERMDRGKRGVPQWWRAAAAIAAALAIVLGALLFRTTQKLHEPRAVWDEQVLFPDGRRGAASEPATLTAKGDSVLLVAPLIEQQKFDQYRLELVSLAGGRSVWSSATLRSPDDDAFAILVPRRFLRRGDYRLVVHGVAGGREEQLATYSLRVP